MEKDQMLNLAYEVAGVKQARDDKSGGKMNDGNTTTQSRQGGKQVISSLFPRSKKQTSNDYQNDTDGGQLKVESYHTHPIKSNFEVSNGVDAQGEDSFDNYGLYPDLASHLRVKMQLFQPTAIQSAALPVLLSKEQCEARDVIIQAQTGSGKSLAYLLPIISQLLTTTTESSSPLNRQDQGTMALILCPTRELANQVNEVLDKVLSLKYLNRWIVNGAITGGESRKSEKARLRKGVSILVTTPGRLLDHMETTYSFKIENLQWFVMDEADRFLEMGFQDAVRKILKVLGEKCPDGAFQSILCSATVSKQVTEIGGIKLRDPHYISAQKANKSANRSGSPQEKEQLSVVPNQLKQYYAVVPVKQRLVALCAFIIQMHNTRKVFKYTEEQFTKTIIFMSNCDSIDFHYELLTFKEEEGGNAQGGIMNNDFVKKLVEADQLDSDQLDDADDGEDDDIEQELSEGSGDASDSDAQQQTATISKDVKKSDLSRTLSAAFGDRADKVLVLKLHGNISHEDRMKTFKLFKNVKDRHVILLSTDVSARGLDIPNVGNVIQYDVPTDIKDYLHRMGRTARMGQSGDGVLFLMPHEVDYLTQLYENGVQLSAKDMKVVFKSFQPTHQSANNNNKDQKVNHQLQETISHFHLKLENNVQNDQDLKFMAKKAYMSTVKAYATHPAEHKAIFHIKRLHLGHLAKAFCLREMPSKLRIGKENFRISKQTGADDDIGDISPQHSDKRGNQIADDMDRYADRRSRNVQSYAKRRELWGEFDSAPKYEEISQNRFKKLKRK
ncbi:hypothetical protein MIR68_001265 [Amoeboaphelidium protococcarum]|nr:hypothetical protein MIR68_001265 [Amoeboaphelidium protococcarum]